MARTIDPTMSVGVALSLICPRIFAHRGRPTLQINNEFKRFDDLYGRINLRQDSVETDLGRSGELCDEIQGRQEIL